MPKKTMSKKTLLKRQTTMNNQLMIFTEAWAIRTEYFRAMLECVQSPDGLFDPDMEVGRAETDYEGTTAVIPVKGPLMNDASPLMQMLFGASSYQTITSQIEAAAMDDSITSIVLDVNSPGGTIAGIADVVAAVKGAGKPVVAYTSGIMASAAYWIASAADSIVASPQAVVGSIGAVMTITDYSKADEQAGVEEIEIVSSQSPHKRPNPKTDEGKATLQAHIDELAQVFIDSVAENRGTTPENVLENYGQGRVFVGNSAKTAGMVDSIGVFNELFIGGNMPTAKQPMDRVFLNENYPDLVASILEEGAAREQSAVADAVAAERERVTSIMAMAVDAETVGIAVQAVTLGLAPDAAKVMVGASVDAARKMAEKHKPAVTPLSAEMAQVENPDLGAGDVELSDEDKFIESIIAAGRSAGVRFQGGAA